MAVRRIYLDYNATTPIAPSVYEAMVPYLTEQFGNPSSHHALGRIAHEAMEESREHVATVLGAEPEEIIFTSGGTEANNLALLGTFLQHPPSIAGHLIISALEHPAVVAPARFLERWGVAVTVVGCNRLGVVDPDEVEAALRDDTRLVSIMHANNEIGTLQPLAEIARRCRRRRVLVHTDAAQTVGKVPLHVRELGVDLLTLAGHKFYAPKGIGALYVRKSVLLEPVVRGAGHERGLRPGTENVAGIVGLGLAARLVGRSVAESPAKLAALRDRLEAHLQEAIGPRLVIHGSGAMRLPNTSSVSFPGISGAALLASIPELCASTGSACHSGTQIASPTLAALGVSVAVAAGTVRFSVGWTTSQEEIDRAAALVADAWERLRTAGGPTPEPTP